MFKEIGSVVLMLVCFSSMTFAGKLGDALETITSVKSIAATLGVSVFGLLGILFDLKTIIKEFTDVVQAIQKLIERAKLTPEVKAVGSELIEALDVLSRKLSKRPFGRGAAKRVSTIADSIRAKLD